MKGSKKLELFVFMGIDAKAATHLCKVSVVDSISTFST